MPTATEDEIAWAAVEQLSVDAAALLLPAFEAHNGRNGRLSIQTDPRLYRDADAIVEQARALPCAGAEHDREDSGDARRHRRDRGGDGAGHQHQRDRVLHAAAVRGRGRSGRARAASAARRPVTTSARMGPVCTIMVGRLDDWLKVVMEKRRHQHRPGSSRMGGRGGVQEDLSAVPRARLSHAAAVGRVPQPHALERADRRRRRRSRRRRRGRSDSSRATSTSSPRIDTPVRSARSSTICTRRFADFRRAYDEGALAVGEFDAFAPTRRTLRQFLAACGDLNQLVRDVMLPNPDVK